MADIECTLCGDVGEDPEFYVLGQVGIIPVTLCLFCRNGLLEFAESQGMVSLAQVYEKIGELE